MHGQGLKILAFLFLSLYNYFMKRCSVDNCTRPYYAKTFCSYHYVKNKKRYTCIMEDCTKPQWSNQLCSMHHRRKDRHGDPNYINPKCNRDGKYLERAVVKSAKWKKENPKLNNAYNKTRKRKIKETKLKSVNDDDMIKIYANCPEGCQVDHIIPINHELISGLHVPWNIQYLTRLENMIKSNKFDGTYENESWRKDIK